MSAMKMAESGNTVVLNRNDPHIYNEKTKEGTTLRREGKIYVVDLWVRIPNVPTQTMNRRNRHPNVDDPMEIDAIQLASTFRGQAP